MTKKSSTMSGDVVLSPSDADGVCPEQFYSTTNFPTFVRLDGAEVEVESLEMDVGIRVERKDGAGAGSSTAALPAVGVVRAVGCPMHQARKGDRFVVGTQGVRVAGFRDPLQAEDDREAFRFMANAVSSERPKLRLIRQLA